MKNTNPFSKMMVSFDPENLFGHRAEVQTILQGVCAKSPRSFVLHANRAIGKTALLHYLCHPNGAVAHYQDLLGEFAPQRNNRLEFIYADYYNVSGDEAISVLYSQMIKNKRVIETLNMQPTSGTLSSKPEAKREIRDICERLQDMDTRLVICIDHFDKAYRSLILEDDRFLRSLTQFQAFVYATEKSLPELRAGAQKSSPLYGILIPREIGILNKEEASNIVIEPTKTLQPAFTSKDATFLLDITGQHPYLLILACEYLYNLYQETPDLQAIIYQYKEPREQVIHEILSMAAVQEIFTFFWDELANAYQAQLNKIARHERLDKSEQSAINHLRKRGLVNVDRGVGGQPTISSELFRIFILGREVTIHRGLKSDDLKIPPIDQKLLDYLQAQPGLVCTFDELLTNVWGDPETTKSSLDAAVHRLRRTLRDVGGTDWIYIENVRGIGFKYNPLT